MIRVERGPFFEDFHEGQLIDHPGEINLNKDTFDRLVKQLGFDDQLIHVDPDYAKSQGFEDIILPGPIVYALVFRLSRRDVSWSGINRQTEKMKHHEPVYPGDILTANSEVISVGEWAGKRGATNGLVTVQTKGLNQNDQEVIEFQRSVLNPFR